MESVLVVGTVSNVAKSLKNDITKIYNSLVRFDRIYFFLVESDSDDNTLEILDRLSSDFLDFEYISLGRLKTNVQDRVERIRYCRNVYVNKIRNTEFAITPKFTIVADLDNINNKLSAASINSCFLRSDWDVVLPNQTQGYYDIFALRSKGWQEGDCFQELLKYRLENPFIPKSRIKFINSIKHHLYFDSSQNKCVYSKMRKLKKNQNWIPVLSGFGGIAIYKTEIFFEFDYSDDGRFTKQSEHVSLNTKIVECGKNISINPSFINCNVNTYNINRYFLIRQIRKSIWYKQLLNILKSSDKKLT